MQIDTIKQTFLVVSFPKAATIQLGCFSKWYWNKKFVHFFDVAVKLYLYYIDLTENLYIY